LHPSAACLKKASNGFSRTFKAPVHQSVTELAELLSSAAERRILSLLGIARRSQKLASGTSAVDAELSAGRCHLVVVATDARSAARATQVQQAVAQGKALAWGTKAVLGGLAGRTEAGVVAVMDDGLANALKATIAMAQSARAAGTEAAPGPARDRVLQWKAETESSTEVG
jgi:ribosomal protein L7Ae-like RNA K-turn-binding protein